MQLYALTCPARTADQRSPTCQSAPLLPGCATDPDTSSTGLSCETVCGGRLDWHPAFAKGSVAVVLGKENMSDAPPWPHGTPSSLSLAILLARTLEHCSLRPVPTASTNTSMPLSRRQLPIPAIPNRPRVLRGSTLSTQQSSRGIKPRSCSTYQAKGYAGVKGWA